MFCTRLREARLTRDAVNPSIVSYVCKDKAEFDLLNREAIMGGRLGVKRRLWVEARLMNPLTGEYRLLAGDETFAVQEPAAPPAPPETVPPPAAPVKTAAPPAAEDQPPPLPPAAPKNPAKKKK